MGLCVLGAACPPAKQQPDPFFSGLPTAKPPPGAEQISPEDFKALIESGDGWVLLDDSAVERTREALERDRETVATWAAAHPDAADRLKPYGHASDFTDTRDGTPVVLMGDDARTTELAAAFRTYETRDNQLALYELQYDALPDAEKARFVAPSALNGEPQWGPLNAAIGSMAGKLISPPPPFDPHPPNFPAEPNEETFGPDRNWCNPPEGMYTLTDFPLKPFFTPARNQGPRGTCGMHGAIALIERRIAVDTGTFLNLSEQDLYARYHSLWFPQYNFYGDGSSPFRAFTVMNDAGVLARMERHVPYNPSRDREQDDETFTYTHSCDGYDGGPGNGCTDTTHQRPMKCTALPIGVGSLYQGSFCAAQLNANPAAPVPGTTPKSWVQLGLSWTPETRNAIAAALKLRHPVYVGLTVTNESPATIDGAEVRGVFVNKPYTNTGGHIEEAVGIIFDEDLVGTSFQPLIGQSGGGFLMLRNSWGCGGDHGIYYYSFNYLKKWFDCATTLTKLDRYRPAVGLSVSPAGPIFTNQPLVLTAKAPPAVNPKAIARVEFYDGSHKLVQVTTPADAATGTWTHSISANGAINGRHRYWARAIVEENGLEWPGLSNPVDLVVSIDSIAPVVALKFPGAALGSSTTTIKQSSFPVVAQVADTGPREVSFFLDEHLFRTDDVGPPFTANATAASAGFHEVEARAVDYSGNLGTKTAEVFVDVHSSGPPVIHRFSVSPTTLPADGGTVIIEVAVSGANYYAVRNAAEPADIYFDTLGDEQRWFRVPLQVTATTTIQLQASNPDGGVSALSTVTVADDQAPTVTLSATPTSVTTPGQLTLTAVAQDNVGVTKVDFYEGQTLLGTDLAPPYTWSIPVSAADNGVRNFTAKAHDTQGNLGTSAISVTVAILPVISAFTAMPATVPAAGGLTTLVWSVQGATALSIDQGVGPVSGTAVTRTVAAPTTFTLTATNSAGMATAQTTVALAPDTQAPSVSLTSTPPSPVTTPTTLTLAASAADDVGVTAVDFYEGPTLLGSDPSPPWSWSLPLTLADNGQRTFTARARDAANNLGVSAPLTVTVAIPPTVNSFTASPTRLPGGGGQVTLSWDVNGATSVEIDQGVGAVSASGSTTQQVVATKTFRLTALNAGASATAQVTVTVEALLDVWVSTTGNDTNPGSEAAPFLTLAHALTVVSPGRTVFLAAGTYDASTQPTFGGTTFIDVPAGLTVRGAPGQVVVLKGQGGPGVRLATGASVRELVFEDFGTAVRAEAAGAALVEQVLFRRTAAVLLAPPTISVGGMASLTLAPGNLTNLVGANMANVARVESNGQLTLAPGAVVDGLVSPGGADNAAFTVADSAQLVVEGTLRNSAQQVGVRVLNAGRLEVRSGGLLENAGASAAVQARDTAAVLCTGGSLTLSEHGIRVPLSASASPTLTLSGCTVTGHVGSGILVEGGNTPGLINVQSSALSSNGGAGLTMISPGAVRVIGGTVANNTGRGLDFRSTATLQVEVRNVTVTGNGAQGIFLGGNLSSSFLLGTMASPGNNTFSGNGISNLQLGSAAGLVVQAVGNTWTPGIQRADAAGRYTAAPGTTLEETGPTSGGNYTITTGGTLRLAQSP